MSELEHSDFDGIDGDYEITCESCGQSSHYEDFGVVGSCVGNMFCPVCETEVDGDGRIQLLCGHHRCFGCNSLKADGSFDSTQAKRSLEIMEKRRNDK